MVEHVTLDDGVVSLSPRLGRKKEREDRKDEGKEREKGREREQIQVQC